MFSWPIVFTVVSGFCFSALGLCYKTASARACRATPFAVVFSAVAAGISLVATGWQPTNWLDSRLWVMGVGVGICWYLAILAIIYANLWGPATISWVVVNLSLLVPIGMAPLLFHEPLYLVDFGVLALFILMLLAFARGMAEGGESQQIRVLPFVLVLTGLFFINGLALIMSKVKQDVFHESNSAAYMAIFYGTCAIIGTLVHLLGARKRTAFTREEWRVGALAGLCSSFGVLLLLLAMSLPTVVVYPVSQGLALIGGVFLTKFIYREHFTLYKWLGVAFGLAVLLTAVCREPLAHLLDAHLLSMLHSGK